MEPAHSSVLLVLLTSPGAPAVFPPRALLLVLFAAPAAEAAIVPVFFFRALLRAGHASAKVQVPYCLPRAVHLAGRGGGFLACIITSYTARQQ